MTWLGSRMNILIGLINWQLLKCHESTYPRQLVRDETKRLDFESIYQMQTQSAWSVIITGIFAQVNKTVTGAVGDHLVAAQPLAMKEQI